MSLLPGLDGKHDSLFVIMIMFVFRSLFPHVPQPSGQRVAMNNAPSPSMTVYMRCLDVVSMDCPISYLLTAFYVIVNIIVCPVSSATTNNASNHCPSNDTAVRCSTYAPSTAKNDHDNGSTASHGSNDDIAGATDTSTDPTGNDSCCGGGSGCRGGIEQYAWTKQHFWLGCIRGRGIVFSSGQFSPLSHRVFAFVSISVHPYIHLIHAIYSTYTVSNLGIPESPTGLGWHYDSHCRWIRPTTYRNLQSNPKTAGTACMTEGTLYLICFQQHAFHVNFAKSLFKIILLTLSKIN